MAAPSLYPVEHHHRTQWSTITVPSGAHWRAAVYHFASVPFCQWHHVYQRWPTELVQLTELVAIQTVVQSTTAHDKPLVHIFTDSWEVANRIKLLIKPTAAE